MSSNIIYSSLPTFPLTCFTLTELRSVWSQGSGYVSLYTAVSRKAVGKRARDNPERYCGWFLVHCFSKKFQRMAREAMDICLRVLKESTKVGSTATVSTTSVLIISHITFRDCRVHSFCDNLSRNSCIKYFFRNLQYKLKGNTLCK